MRIASLALTAIVLAAACGGSTQYGGAAASPTPEPTVVVADNPLGKILVAGSNKMTLYVFAKDTADTSNCNDQCAITWPPFTITGSPVAGAGITGKLGTAARKDGAKQLTWNNKPLYFYSKDTKAGDTVGNNFAQNWFVVTNP